MKDTAEWKRGPSPTKTDCARCEKTIEVGDPVAARDTGRTIQYICQKCDADMKARIGKGQSDD